MGIRIDIYWLNIEHKVVLIIGCHYLSDTGIINLHRIKINSDLFVPEPDISYFLFKSQVIHIISSISDTVGRRGRIGEHDQNSLASSMKFSKKKSSIIYF